MSEWDRGSAVPETWAALRPLWAGLAKRTTGAASRVGLPHLLLLAVLLRIAALAVSTPAHPDEVYQYLETAHRLVFGYGVVTWEWREGIRGWLLPMLVSIPMRLGDGLAPQSGLYLLAPKLVMVAASLVTVAVAWRLGGRISRLHAQVAGFVAAIWYEFVYFAPHVMSETAAIALILPAALLLMDKARWSGWRLGSAAALLACAAAIRFQYLAAIGALVIACCALDLRRCWLPLLIGGLVGLLPSALCDWAMGATPFAWLIENIRFNFLEHRAESFGTSGPFGYAEQIWPRLMFWVVPLVGFAALGARRYPALAWMAGANLLFHSAIAHKEYRFIFLSMLVTVLLAAMGTVDLVVRNEGADPARNNKLRLVCAAWALASFGCAFGAFQGEWTRNRPEMDLFGQMRRDPALCGVAVYRHEYAKIGGYAYLHRAVPMLLVIDQASPQPSVDLARAAPTFNLIVTAQEHAGELPAAFKPASCEGADEHRVCLYQRPGACTGGDAGLAISDVLHRLGR